MLFDNVQLVFAVGLEACLTLWPPEKRQKLRLTSRSCLLVLFLFSLVPPVLT